VKKLLNTLYVTTQGAYLAREGETVLARHEQENLLRVPIHTLAGIACFSQVSCSPPLMGLCADNNVALSFLTEHGRFLARVQGPVNGNVLLRREQYRKADEEEATASIARAAVMAKIANCRTLVLRGTREHEDPNAVQALDAAAARLARILTSLDKATTADAVRGFEGEGASVYFSVFDHLITVSKETFFFRERSRRPPLDNVNALLSFLYTLLVEGALEAVGLDPAVGYLAWQPWSRPARGAWIETREWPAC